MKYLLCYWALGGPLLIHCDHKGPLSVKIENKIFRSSNLYIQNLLKGPLGSKILSGTIIFAKICNFAEIAKGEIMKIMTLRDLL